MNKVRVRIAPSPTGDPHVGTAYIALFNMIFARHFGGTFIIRIEDTDRTRSRLEYEKNIFNALKWCNITWDEGPDVGGPYGPYRQSERSELYRHYAYELVKQGKAYKDFATPEELALLRTNSSTHGYNRAYRNLSPEEITRREHAGEKYTIRLKVPLTGECVFHDALKGTITVPYADIDDQILLKSDGFPTYHLAAVVDDHCMEISHIIRGDEWISSTAKHVYLYECFGWEPPIFLHMPLLLGKDGKKLSKRKNPTSIFFYRDSGYLPEAFVNFLTLMGYSTPQGEEIYPLDELITHFDPQRIGSSSAIFDTKKLDWMNQHYLMNKIPENQLWPAIREWGFQDAFMERLMPLCHTRIKNFGEFIELCGFFFMNHIAYTGEMLIPKNTSPEETASVLQCMIWEMEALEDWSRIGAEKASHTVAERLHLHHKKQIIPILFMSLTGKHSGPPLFASIELLGKDRTRARLLHGISLVGGLSNNQQESLSKRWVNIKNVIKTPDLNTE